MPETYQYATPAYVSRLWHGLSGGSGLGILTLDAGGLTFSKRNGSSAFDHPLSDITVAPIMRSGTKFRLTTADGRQWLLGFWQNGKGLTRPLRVNPLGVEITQYDTTEAAAARAICGTWHDILDRSAAATS